jgi:glycosyltransferase involved in cell wall biosynthesis
VIIKALNEERHIARAIESALAAVGEVAGGGEVILADSLSTDRTVEIARHYPVRIVQLTDPRDRSCGVGAQLGMAAARGEFLYILDGDMELLPGFLGVAVRALDAEQRLAGVAGVVQEMHAVNLVFMRRQQATDTTQPGTDAHCLNMGGLYRRDAVTPMGYLTNRNLHAFEEFELGVRLQQAGWRLARLGVPSVRHYGHSEATFKLLWRRWRSRYAWGHGELLRQAWHAPHRARVLRSLGLYALAALVMGCWAAWVACAWLLPWPPVALVALPFLWWGVVWLAMALRKRSLALGAFSVLAWHVSTAGLVRGLLATPHARAEEPVAHRVLQ